MRKIYLLFTMLLFMIWFAGPGLAVAQQADEEPAVYAILFYSPTCPHCHHVIDELLIPMVEDYGEQLQIVGIDTSQPGGGQLYQAAIDHFQIPNERRGVPTLIIGDTVLVGSMEIPDQFPTLVEDHLAAGGIGWPDIPGLEQALASDEEQEPPTPTPEAVDDSATPAPLLPTVTSAGPEAQEEAALTPAPQVETTAETTPTSTPLPAVAIAGDEPLPVETEAAAAETPPDPVGFTIAGIMLVGMVAALGYAGWRLKTILPYLSELDRNPISYAKTWLIPFLGLIGFGVSAYLAYVEINQVKAVCGPIGECNIVQSSSYAQIFGIPIAVLGMLNYFMVTGLWAGQYAGGQVARLSALALLGLTLFGTLFSIYLTLLELFVIHAICAWCLSSALISTLLMLLVVIPVTRESSGRETFLVREQAQV